MLMVLRVPVRAMMDMMGWSAASMATRYTHVPDEVRHEYAAQLGGLLWAANDSSADELSTEQLGALKALADGLPEPWRT
jgi:integrase